MRQLLPGHRDGEQIKGKLDAKQSALRGEGGAPALAHLPADQLSDHKSAYKVLGRLPWGQMLISARGYESNRCRGELATGGCRPCI